LIPLWALIFISYISGGWLANVESPHELESNDAVMAHTAKLNLMANLFANVSSFAMFFCVWAGDNAQLEEFNDFLQFLNSTQNQTHLEEILAEASDTRDITVHVTTDVTTGAGGEDIFINVSAATLIECTDIVQNLTSVMFGTLGRYAISLDDPTFNWNRCSDEVDDSNFMIPFPDLGRPEVANFTPVSVHVKKTPDKLTN
jgi:hypothetical protein